VDAVLAGTRIGPAPLPKGLAAPTLQLVSDVLRRAGSDLSAVEVAERAGLSRVAARRYLEHLTQSGRATLTLRYGAAGRPEHRYHWRAELVGHPSGTRHTPIRMRHTPIPNAPHAHPECATRPSRMRHTPIRNAPHAVPAGRGAS
jgi:hypothetical protein